MFRVVHEFEESIFERLGLTEEEARDRATELSLEGIESEIIEYGSGGPDGPQ